MPAGKRQQSNGWLYAAVTFVGLFLVTTALAVIYYVKTEDLSKQVETLTSQTNELATGMERQRMGTMVGEKQPRKSRLGTMVDYLDQMVGTVIGGPTEDTSAQVKVETANRKVKDMLELLAKEYPDVESADPNAAGLVRTMEKLKVRLDTVKNEEFAAQRRLKELRGRFDDAVAAGFEKEQTLLAEKERYQQRVGQIERNYNELEALMKQTTERQVQTLVAQRDEARDERRELNQRMLKTQAELKMAVDRIKKLHQELTVIKPLPDIEARAYKPDGKIILVDNQNRIVHLDIGSDERVYRGLTFSVYEKNMPIPGDGKGKAK